jgi:MscS family membrane protein
MDSLLDQIFLGNTLRDYLWVVAILLFTLLLNRVISRYIAIALCRVFRRRWKTFDQQKFVSLIIHPLAIFLTISVSIAALYRLNLPPQLNFRIYKYPLDRILLTLAVSIQIIAFIWLLLRVIDFIALVLETKAQETIDQTDNQLIVFFRDFLKVVIGIIGLMMVLHFAFNYNVSSLLTGLSIVGAAIALALRESLENLIASFVIFFDKPFKTGDFVRVQNVAGAVERIGLRSTRVRTTEKSYVTVPNKQMVDSILDNVSLRSQIRGEINLMLQPTTTSVQMENLLAAVKGYLASVSEIENSNVLFNDIRIHGFLVFIEFFTPPLPWPQFTAIRQGVNLFVLQKVDELGIALTYDTKG